MKPALRALIFLVVILGLGFALARFLNDNNEGTQLQFVWWRTREISKGMLVLMSFLIGLGVAAFFSFSAVVSKTFEASRLRRENLALQKLVEERTQTGVKAPPV